MRLSSKMSLTLWDDFVNDPYSPQQLLDNWLKVDFHDHSPGRGVQIARAGIAAGAIGPNQLGNDIPWVPSENTLALRPPPGTFGRIFYATDTDQWFADNGVSWEQIAGGNPLNLYAGNGNRTVQFGHKTVNNWDGTNYFTPTATINHDLGVAPQWVFVSIDSTGYTLHDHPLIVWTFNYTTTQFNWRVFSVTELVPTAATAYGSFSWMAVG